MKVKRYLVSTLLLSAGFSLIWSCQKGENDPFLSLRSRKARLSGEWALVSGKRVSGDTTYTYDADGLVITIDTAVTEELPITMSMIIDRDGKFERSIVYDYPVDWNGGDSEAHTDTYNQDGIWNFTGGAEDTKTKSQLLMNTTKIESRSTLKGANVNLVEYDGQPKGVVYNIDKLEYENLVIKFSSTKNFAGGSYLEEEEWVFSKK